MAWRHALIVLRTPRLTPRDSADRAFILLALVALDWARLTIVAPNRLKIFLYTYLRDVRIELEGSVVLRLTESTAVKG